MGDRPPHLSPGATLQDTYAIEGLVRVAEGRMFYLAYHVDDPLKRYLISARWEANRFDAYLAFVEAGIEHPGIAAPIDAFVVDGTLFSIVSYAGDGLLLDEASPLSTGRALNLAQRLVGSIVYLERRGYFIHALGRANVLLSPDGVPRLYDVDFELPNRERPETERVARLAAFMAAYSHPRATDIRSLFAPQNGGLPQWSDFGRSIEALALDQEESTLVSQVAAITDVGLVRQLNEDSWGWASVDSSVQVYVVADGMGGHHGGEVASALAVETVVEDVRKATWGGETFATEQQLGRCFRNANNTVKAAAESHGTDMGTTLVVALIVDQRTVHIANVGDSRAYLWRDGALSQITKDHSLVQKMVDRGRLSGEEARVHPHANILLRTVGTERDVPIDHFVVELEAGDRILLCTDGLWGEVEDDAISVRLREGNDVRTTCRDLVRDAQHAGGKDNITVLIAGV